MTRALIFKRNAEWQDATTRLIWPPMPMLDIIDIYDELSEPDATLRLRTPVMVKRRIKQ